MFQNKMVPPTMSSQKQLLEVLHQHVQLLTVEKYEQTNLEIRNAIVEHTKVNKELQENLKEEKILNEQLKKKKKIYYQILSEKKQDYIKKLMEGKNKFEEVMDDIEYLHLKLELKGSMKRELEVYIDDETKKLNTEKEIIDTIGREFEVQSITTSEMLMTLNEQKAFNEVLKNELKNERLKLEQSQKLQLENKIKFTIAEKFNQNVLHHKNNLIYNNNLSRKEITSLSEIRKINEMVNKRLINIILLKNLVGLTDNVKILLLELDRCNQYFRQVKSEEYSNKVVVTNNTNQLYQIHGNYDLKLKNKNIKINDSENVQAGNTDSLVVDSLQCRNTGGGDCARRRDKNKKNSDNKNNIMSS